MISIFVHLLFFGIVVVDGVYFLVVVSFVSSTFHSFSLVHVFYFYFRRAKFQKEFTRKIKERKSFVKKELDRLFEIENERQKEALNHVFFFPFVLTFFFLI